MSFIMHIDIQDTMTKLGIILLCRYEGRYRKLNSWDIFSFDKSEMGGWN